MPGDTATLPLLDWQAAGRLGGLVTCELDGEPALLAELKWCHSKSELGWTLWDRDLQARLREDPVRKARRRWQSAAS